MSDQRNRSLIRSSLLKKGFVEFTKGRDHDFYFLYINNKKTQIFTKLSRGSKYKTYNRALLDLVKKQLKLNFKQLLDFIDCPIQFQDYLVILTKNGIKLD
jgi:hypothetical protein